MAKKRGKPKSNVRSKPKKDWFGRIMRIGPVLWGGISALLTIFFVLLIFGLVSLPAPSDLGTGNVAVLTVDGVILTSGQDSPFGGGVATADSIVDRIQRVAEDPEIEGLLLEINSPGGSPVASDEIGRALKKLDKPTVAVIREVGASGGYWIASATDHIIANRMSVTGSIGVVGSSFGFENVLEQFNVTYRRLVAGDLKDTGSPYRAQSDAERDLMQQLIDSIYDEFVDEVSENRGMPRAEVEQLANGFVYLGKEARNNGLIDELGGMDEAKAFFEKDLNKTIEFAYFRNQPGLFDLFGGVMAENSHAIGMGIGDSLKPRSEWSIQLR